MPCNLAEDRQQSPPPAIGSTVGQQHLLQRRRKTERLGNQVGHDAKGRPAREHRIKFGVKDARSARDIAEGVDQIRTLRRIKLLEQLDVVEDLDLRLAVKRRDFKFPDDANPCAALQEQVEPAVRQAVVVDDPAKAGNGLDRGLIGGRPVGVGQNLDNRDQPIPIEGILGHLPIPRLKNVQGLHGMGEQHDARQGEQSTDAREVAEVKILVHAKAPHQLVRRAIDRRTRIAET